MSKHTPGPWEFVETTDGGWVTGPDRTVSVVCDIVVRDEDVGGLPTDEDMANGRLIAVAPEMDALLAEMEEWLRQELEKEPDRTFFWKIVHLRAKAEGR